MKAGSIVRYGVAWLGFVVIGYALTLMFTDRDAPATTSPTAPVDDVAATNAPEPKDTADLNDATGANINAIDITLASLGGGDRLLSEWSGKPLVVNFWATWCAPCRKEIPLLKALQNEYAEDELTVVGIAIDEMGAVESYSEDAQFNYPVLVGEDSGFRMATAIGVSNLYVPITAFVDRTGEVRRIHTGEIHRDEAEFAISEIVAR